MKKNHLIKGSHPDDRSKEPDPQPEDMAYVTGINYKISQEKDA